MHTFSLDRGSKPSADSPAERCMERATRATARAIESRPRQASLASPAIPGVLIALYTATMAAGLGPTCPVPSTPHPTLTAAIADPSCNQVTLASGSYAESVVVGRSLTIEGPNTGVATIRGRLIATGSSSTVVLRDLEIESGCQSTLQTSGGAQVDAASVDVRVTPTAGCPQLPSGIFDSSFESGDLTEWDDSP